MWPPTRPIAFGLIVAFVQVASVMAIHWAWQSVTGEWSSAMWTAYLVGFPLATPGVAVSLGAMSLSVPPTRTRFVGAWGASAVLNAAFILVAHGLEDAGWPFGASVLAYGTCVAIVGFVACFEA